ncbi:cytochrome c maturation protein CcmE [Limnohabitans sp. TS-CS-82]|jgi:cytochrome c-type biogenesis protein CcmE|uniref:cytochrome c maturation protein CcmE n=1 Tax=Limnohabitans sp. TS-CS-82 TaxID=2094193 RepID=UPI000CF2C75C|nr:cytochrome c maturation protein CcmE [Limnohabitans sp. TS-CS-82]PQA80678.1 cytochrome c maturation protein CcmE [Limnohabitans sp. TS-CS-82]
MKPRTKRLALIVGGIVVLCAAAAFVLNAFQSNLVFFFTPTQVSNGEAPKGRTFRAGGMVKEGSLVRDGNTVRFVITDTEKEMSVTFVGLLPDLFKEGRGVVSQGKLGDDGVFVASEVLAKHDENYMPPEAKHALDQAAAAKAAQSVKTNP